MSVSTMGTNAEIPIPNGWAGQIDTQLSLDSNRPLTNAATTEELQRIDHEIEQLLARRASLDGTAGLVTLTNATDVTEGNGIALSAMQNNASVDGTIRNRLEHIDKNVAQRTLLYQNLNIKEDGDIITLSSDDYHALEVWYAFDPYSGFSYQKIIPGINNISLFHLHVNYNDDFNTYIANRVYTYQSKTAFKCKDGYVRRFNGTFENSPAWLNIYEIWGLKYNL